MTSNGQMLVGVDTGGTFTDFFILDTATGRRTTFKLPSTPDSPSRAVLDGLARIAGVTDLTIRHGTTVATNAVLEGKLARTVYVTNHGFGDVLTIGRQARADLYSLSPEPESPPVPADWCLEISGRISANGEVTQELATDDLETLAAQVAALGAQSIAVNLLFSWLDPSVEARIAEQLDQIAPVCLSSDLIRGPGEYERGVATWLNAALLPVVSGYLRELADGIPAGSNLAVMQSDACLGSVDRVAEQPIRLLLSGPAGGLVAARAIGRELERNRLMTVDVGGTSTDVALIDGDIRTTDESRFGRWPIAVPTVDLHTAGAGGGSIARIDEGGMLRVGPESAGAVPGPACYGVGGDQPTVTDAMLALGRLSDGAGFGGGSVKLSRSRAVSALAGLARHLHCDERDAAQAVVALANENMAAALRRISIERGHDSRAFSLMAFGGAGGLHVCELAELLGIGECIVPADAGVLSAQGMALGAPGVEWVESCRLALAATDESELKALADRVREQARSALLAASVVEMKFALSADARYQGQSFTLSVPWEDAEGMTEQFHRAHESRYGHRFDLPVELANIRVRAMGPAIDAGPVGAARSGRASVQEAERSEPVVGPVRVDMESGTLWVANGWSAVTANDHWILRPVHSADSD